MGIGIAYISSAGAVIHKKMPQKAELPQTRRPPNRFNKQNADALKNKAHHSHSSSSSTSSSSASSDDNLEYDFVIVGGGTAGCALAAKLSDPDKHGKYKHSVLVLEAGKNLTQDPLVLGDNIFFSIPMTSNPIYSKTYQALLLDAADKYGLYTDGRMLGGSSGHNGLQAYRGAPEQYNEWSSITGDSRWSYNSLLNNIWLKMEHYTPDSTPLDTAQRGIRGPVFITQEPPLDSDNFMQGVAAGTNTPFTTDLNDPALPNGDIGVGANQNWVTPTYLGPNSIRSFSANSYLTGLSAPDATPPTVIPAIIDENGNGLNGRKLKVIFEANVNRVLFDKHNQATGVEFSYYPDGQNCAVVKIKKEVILSAGANQDPAILQRSGIGDPLLLSSLDIPIVYANPNVGQNLQTHNGSIGIISGSTIPLPRTGVAFIDLSPYMPADGTRRYQLDIFNTPEFLDSGIRTALGITSGISMAPINLQPGSKGSVTIVSKDPFTDPQINLNFYSDGGPSDVGSDAYKAVSFYKIMQTIAADCVPPRTVLYPSSQQYAGGDDALFGAVLDTINFFSYHNSGTCRMGMNQGSAVCDGRLSVFGVKGLRIADNAAGPVIETGNTAYQAFTIGLECARILRAKYG